MANIITARQALKANGGADISNCAALKHLILPYGKQGTLIDYVTGLHKTSAFTAHGDGWSTANVATGTLVTAGSWFTPGTNNFTAHCVGKFGDGGGFSIGAQINNGGFAIAASGYIKSSVGAIRAINSDIEVGVANGYTLSRLGPASLESRKNGTVSDTAALDPGDIATVDGAVGLFLATEFYGAAIFEFSGDTPANYATVLNEWTTRLLAGNVRLPVEIEDWT